MIKSTFLICRSMCSRSFSSLENRLAVELKLRGEKGTLRSLNAQIDEEPKIEDGSACWPIEKLVDFSSNDYLGLARCPEQVRRVNEEYYRILSQIGLVQVPREEDLDINSEREVLTSPVLGATGSRLLSGDSTYCRSLERYLASVHNRQSALLCNSGYDANVSVLSSIPRQHDIVIIDELCHNSLFMGVRMGRIRKENVWKFCHNDVNHVRELLQTACQTENGSVTTCLHNTRGKQDLSERQVIIAIEGVYSMEGDIAPIAEICDAAKEYSASVIVDEAHGIGIYGGTNFCDMKVTTLDAPTRSKSSHDCVSPTDKNPKSIYKGSSIGDAMAGAGILGALNIEHHPSVLCSVHMFGKAAGCHGAVIVSSSTVIEYLINYARPFVYSTALPLHSLVSIKCAYDTMNSRLGESRRHRLFNLVSYFRCLFDELCSSTLIESGIHLLSSPSPIQCVVVPGNYKCMKISQQLRQRGFSVFPVRAPTVRQGSERLRIIVHAHNTRGEVANLLKSLIQLLINEARASRSGIASRL